MAELPLGTVTFLFTDLEGSTRMWEEFPEAMRDALASHDAILHDAIGKHRGVAVSEMGDGMVAAFASASDALSAAIDVQLELGAHEWVRPVRFGSAWGCTRVRVSCDPTAST